MIIEGKDQIAFLRHVLEPKSRSASPSVTNLLFARPSAHRKNDRICLGRVESRWLDQEGMRLVAEVQREGEEFNGLQRRKRGRC